MNKDNLTNFQTILKTFLNENYKPTDDFYFEKLITQLSCKDRSCFLDLNFTLEWVDECIEIIASNFTKLNEKVITFMIKTCQLYAKHESLIVKVKERQWMDKIKSLIDTNMDKLTPSIKLAFVNLLTEISKNIFGFTWVTNNKLWNILIIFCTENHTVYVQREAQSLIYNILYKLDIKENTEDLCLEILQKITDPIIINNTCKEKSTFITIDDFELLGKLAPTVDLLTFILAKTLESDRKINLSYIFQTNHIELSIWSLTKLTQNTEFFSKILKSLIAFNFAQLNYEKWQNGAKIKAEDFTKFGVNFFNQMKFCVVRRSCPTVLMMAEYNHTLWKKIENRTPSKIFIEYDEVEFENQLILFHLLPVLFMVRSASKGNKQDDCAKDIFEKFITNLFELSTPFTLHICYEFREVLFDCPENAGDLACKSINGVLSMEKAFNKTRAVLVFKALIYAFKDFADDKDTFVIDNLNVLYSILVGLHSIVKRHRITWNDSIESICLLNLSLELLNCPSLTSRIVVQAIKLVQLSIEHFLSPNLALLVDNFDGSGLQLIGPMLLKRLHDNSWEVRDSSLELITSMAEIAQLKYPAFQQYLLDSGICPIIYSMSKNDAEPYIRASAFKCLTQMATINLLWEQGLSKFEIIEYLLMAIMTEYEGIVRKEQVALIIKIYNQRKISSEHTNKLYSTMAYCAINDLHWEVKINALLFWKYVICHQYSNQGMIDGIFPTVTFSKEHKKIVTLTEKEILLRISKILNDLSQLGCLGILIKIIKEDSDLEVVRIAVLIVQKLFESLNKYEYLKTVENVCHGVDYETGEKKENKTNGEAAEEQMDTNENNKSIDADKIIESILIEDDINLLADSYQNNMNCNDDVTNNKRSNINDAYYKTFVGINPNDFINEINKMNLDSLIQSKTDWLYNTESFESLLDDMVHSIKQDDLNSADCY